MARRVDGRLHLTDETVEPLEDPASWEDTALDRGIAPASAPPASSFLA